MGIQNYAISSVFPSVAPLRHLPSGVQLLYGIDVTSRCNVLPSLNCDGEKLYHTVDSDPCHIKDQLRHREGVRKAPLPWFIPLDPAAR